MPFLPFARVVVKSICIQWILAIICWVILPSGPDFSTITVQDGVTVTRVYKVDDYYPSSSHDSVRLHQEPYIVLDFMLSRDPETGLESVKVSAFNNPSRWVTIEPPLPSRQHDVSLVNDSLSAPFLVTSKTANDDGGTYGILYPSWLPTADAVLLTWQFQPKYATIVMHSRVVASVRKMEIWPELQSWSTHDVTPFLTVYANEGIIGEIVSFSFPPCPRSCSPSLFYGLRALAFSSITPLGAVRVAKNAVISFICFRWLRFRWLSYFTHALIAILIAISLAEAIIAIACRQATRLLALLKVLSTKFGFLHAS